MPRPTKAIRRQKINAAIEFRKGNREEAYKLWAKADAARKERQAKRAQKKEEKAPEAPAESTEAAEA